MPDIYPTGKIELYHGIKLDNTYQHTLRYANAAAMETFFNTTTLKKYSLTARQYQRVTSGVCEVAVAINNLYDVNYMRFQNADFSTKWFYAFVTNVEYVNDANSRIYYEIDVLTTYYYDWSFLPSFVEREHAATDVAGDNLVPEPVAFDEPICKSIQRKQFKDWYVCIAVSDYISVSGNRRAIISQAGYMINGCYLIPYDLAVTGRLAQFQEDLSNLAESQADILAVFMYPKDICTIGDAQSADARQSIVFKTVTETLYRPTNLTGIDGTTYTPRNKKLLTSPYCYLAVDNGTITANYQYEYFMYSNTYPNQLYFAYRGIATPAPELYVAPMNYKGLGPGSPVQYMFEERLESAPIPQVAYPIDSYKAWLAQTQSSRQTKVINAAAGGVGTGLVAGAKLGGSVGSAGGPIGAVGGAVIGAALGGVLGALGGKFAADRSVMEAADMKNKATGTGTGCVSLADGLCGFAFKRMQIKLDDARTIDSFFDMFGYAQNKIKTPNIYSRAHWNYVKTNGCNMGFFSSIAGTHGIPADYVRKIKAIHDAGVTYWNSHDDLGNYALTNSIVS